jgi:hypothetical protein
VHSRRPILWRTIGPLGVFGFIFFIGGTFLSGLMNPDVLADLRCLVFMGTDVISPCTTTNLYPSLSTTRRQWLADLPHDDRTVSATAMDGFGLLGNIRCWMWVLMTICVLQACRGLIFNPICRRRPSGLSKHTREP